MKKQEIIDNFAINVEKERLNLGLTQKQMADKLDLSLSAYKQLITATTQKIDVFTLVRLYELTGKLAYEYLGVDDRKLKIVSKLNGLSDQQLVLINAIAEFELQFRKTNINCEDYISVFIPTGNAEDGMIYDSSHVTKVNISEYKKRLNADIHYGIQITSHHMQPCYNKGDIILVSKVPIRDGDTGIFLNKKDGRAYIRKYEKGNPTKLIPINDYGIEFDIDENNPAESSKWIKFGKVIATIR